MPRLTTLLRISAQILWAALTACHRETPPAPSAMPSVSAPAVVANTQAQSDSINKAIQDSVEALQAARRREVRIVADPKPAWFEATRELDLSGDGKADRLVVRAVGTRSDSLSIRLAVIIENDTLLLDHWKSDYELMDPPFPRDTVRAVVDGYIRGRLTAAIAGVEVSIEPITKEILESNAGDECEGGLAACLRTRWGLSLINGKDAAAEVLKGPVPLISFGYGYETSKTVAYVAVLRRFVGISECC